MPQHWPDLLNATDLVMVPTEWNREVFVGSGVRTPVAVVPHVATAPVPGDRGTSMGLRDDDFIFYTIGRWDERKAVFLTLEAYLRAFTADDPVVLVVKTNPRLEMPRPHRGFRGLSLHLDELFVRDGKRDMIVEQAN